ncbi:chloride intracellular channel protein 1-like, partial [Lampetra fluviatilis]
LRGALERALERLDSFLGTALGPEAPAGRPFLDGDRLTLADCNLLPKLHILKVVCKKYRSFEIPRGLRWLHSYLQGAYSREEFLNTCPADAEIEAAYHSAATGVK